MSVVSWFAIFFLVITSLLLVGSMALILLGSLSDKLQNLIEFYLTRKKQLITELEEELGEEGIDKVVNKKFSSN